MGRFRIPGVIALIAAFGIGLFSPHLAAQRGLLPSQTGSGEPLDRGFDVDSATAERIRQFLLGHPSFEGFSVAVEVFASRQPVLACDGGGLELSLISKNRPWGPVQVALQCRRPVWSAVVGAQTTITGAAVVATRFIAAGTRLTAEDVKLLEQDLTRSPPNILRSVTEVENQTASRAVAAGTLLTLNNLREPTVIKVRDSVRVQLQGSGFQVMAEGQALTAGGVGDTIRVKMPDGQVVRARVVKQGLAEMVLSE